VPVVRPRSSSRIAKGAGRSDHPAVLQTIQRLARVHSQGVCDLGQRPLLGADSTGRCNTLNLLGAGGVLRMKQRPRIYYSDN
jgi:hypothetical protein